MLSRQPWTLYFALYLLIISYFFNEKLFGIFNTQHIIFTIHSRGLSVLVFPYYVRKIMRVYEIGNTIAVFIETRLSLVENGLECGHSFSIYDHAIM